MCISISPKRKTSVELKLEKPCAARMAPSFVHDIAHDLGVLYWQEFAKQGNAISALTSYPRAIIMPLTA